MPLGEILSYQNDGTFRRKEAKPGESKIEGLVDGHFDEYNAALYFVDILHGLAYLHEKHIVHRDLKPEKCVGLLYCDCGLLLHDAFVDRVGGAASCHSSPF